MPTASAAWAHLLLIIAIPPEGSAANDATNRSLMGDCRLMTADVDCRSPNANLDRQPPIAQSIANRQSSIANRQFLPLHIRPAVAVAGVGDGERAVALRGDLDVVRRRMR